MNRLIPLEHWDIGSNPTRGINVYVPLFRVCVVLYVGSGLATGRSLVQGVYRLCLGLRNWKSGQGTKGCRARKRETVFSFFGLWDYWHCGHSWPIVPASGDSEDDCGEQMERRLAAETEVLGENLPQRHFCPSQNPTWPDPGLNPGRRGGKPTTNRRETVFLMIIRMSNDYFPRQR
jgi:hypothetical protein